MFFPKRMLTKSSGTKAFSAGFKGAVDSVTDQLQLPQTAARYGYNATCTTGALTETEGIEEFITESGKPLPVTARRVWYLETQTGGVYALYGKDGVLYSVNAETGEYSQTENAVFSAPPECVRYRLGDKDVLILSNSEDGLHIFDGETCRRIDGAPKISSMCVHYERLFGVTGKDGILWFSDDLDPTNWNVSLEEAGYIELADDRGKLLKVLSFGDCLYVFRENGISRVSAYARQTDFTVTQMFTASGRIYADTVAITGDRVMFLAQDGLYVFTSSGASKVYTLLKETISEDNRFAAAAYCRGSYVLAFRAEFPDRKDRDGGAGRNNALFIADVQSGEYFIMRGMDVCFVSALRNPSDSTVFCFRDYAETGTFGKRGLLFGESLFKCRRLPLTDLGQSYADKTILYAVLYTKYDIVFSVICDGVEKRYTVKGSPRARKVPLNVKGRLFSFGFETDSPLMEVSLPKIVYRTYSAEV